MAGTGTAGHGTRIRGARVLVTGATGGVGGALARELARQGAVPLLTGRRTDLLEALATEVGGRCTVADLTSAEQLRDLVGWADPVDVAVLNAALPAAGALTELSAEEVDRALDVNLRAPVQLARLLATGMVDRGHGHLVFVASLAGKIATPYNSLYVAGKFGLRGLGLSLRQELAPRGVRVSTVFPGFISGEGMFAETGVAAPAGVGTSTPEQVAAGIIRAVRRDRAELDVAPLLGRVGALLGTLVPELAAAAQRRVGATGMMRALAERQRGRR